MKSKELWSQFFKALLMFWLAKIALILKGDQTFLAIVLLACGKPFLFSADASNEQGIGSGSHLKQKTIIAKRGLILAVFSYVAFVPLLPDTFLAFFSRSFVRIFSFRCCFFGVVLGWRFVSF